VRHIFHSLLEAGPWREVRSGLDEEDQASEFDRGVMAKLAEEVVNMVHAMELHGGAFVSGFSDLAVFGAWGIRLVHFG